jgi:glutaconate CoA-transferase, subunit A
MLMALQAGASGIDWTPAPGLLGSDLMRVRPDWKTIPDPYDPGGRPVALLPAINPDVALVHALRAGPDGSLVLPATGDSFLLIRAARMTLATAEVVVDEPIETLAAGEMIVPGIYVDAVAPAPHGAYPLRCGGLYDDDRDHLRRYVAAAKDPAAWPAYLAEITSGSADERASRERVLAVLEPAGD